MTARKLITFDVLRAKYKGDEDKVCLAEGLHPICGPYLCTLPKGHEGSEDVRLSKAHQSPCRKHHCCVISWEVESTGAAASASDVAARRRSVEL